MNENKKLTKENKTEPEAEKTAKTRKPFLKKGSYHGTAAVGITAIAIAIVILLNLLVGQLPSSVKQLDLTGNKIYSISDVTVNYIAGLQNNIHLIMLSDGANTDNRIRKFVNNYVALSDKITAEEIDTLLHPTVLSTYSCKTNTLVVINSDTGKFTTIPYEDTSDSLILESIDSSTYKYYEAEFDADGEITSAVSYVTGDFSHTIYTLSGHDEADLSTAATAAITKDNLNINSDGLNLLQAGSIPDDCDLIMIYKPTSDLADDELSMLLDYMQNGGKLMIVLSRGDLTNFNTLLADYGYAVQNGVVGDTGAFYQAYASSYGYYCFDMTYTRSNEMTQNISTDILALYPVGLLDTTPIRDTITTESFLTTSSSGGFLYSSDGTQTSGSYILGAYATEDDARLTVFSNPYIVDDSVVEAYPSFGNLTVFMNALTANFSDIQNLNIPSKSLSEESYNTVSNYGVWFFLYVFALPLATFFGGLIFWSKRRKR